MAKNDEQSVSPSVNANEEPAAATTTKQERKRAGLKLHTNIKAGALPGIRSHPEESSELA